MIVTVLQERKHKRRKVNNLLRNSMKLQIQAAGLQSEVNKHCAGPLSILQTSEDLVDAS